MSNNNKQLSVFVNKTKHNVAVARTASGYAFVGGVLGSFFGPAGFLFGTIIGGAIGASTQMDKVQ